MVSDDGDFAIHDDDGLSGLLRRGLKAAIARWAVLRRPGAADWPRPQDEAPHPWDGRRYFAEEYVLVAVQAELAVVARLEWLPGRDAHRVWMTVMTPNAVYALPGGGQALLRGGEEHRWRAGGLQLDCVEPHRTWNARYRGSLELRDVRGGRRGEAGEDAPPAVIEARIDLTFLADVPPFVPGSDDDPDLLSRQLGAAEWDTRLLRVVRRRTLKSYVQPGDVHGTLILGPQILTFGGAGLRVHSWGVRDWGASDAALQCFSSIGPARTWVHTARFPWVTLTGGFVQRPGGLVPIRDLGVTLERHPTRAPSHVGLAIEAPGGALALEAETVAELPLEMDGRGRLDIAFVRVRQRGATGWGLCFSQRRLLPRPEPRPG